MRLLFLTPQLPYPPHQGTALRNFHILKHLAPKHEVHLLSFRTAEQTEKEIAPLRSLCARVETVPAPPSRPLLQRAKDSLLSRLPDMGLRLESPAFREALRKLLQNFTYDIVQIEGIEMAPYMRESVSLRQSGSSSPLIVFDDHNAEYLLQQRAAFTDLRHPSRWPQAIYSLIQWRKLIAYERNACQQADLVLAVSAEDAEAIRRLDPSLKPVIIPNGVDIAYYRAYQPTEEELYPIQRPSIVFTGKMDYRPNVDAALWFGCQIWPRVRAVVPEARFYVVGQRPHPSLDTLRVLTGVTVTGRVPDVRPYLAAADVYVIPLRIGSGTRLKLLEAMAMGCAVVSTSLGCAGYAITPGQELLVANTPQAFANAVIELLQNPTRRQALAQHASAFVAQYDWSAILPHLEEAYQALLVQRKNEPSE